MKPPPTRGRRPLLIAAVAVPAAAAIAIGGNALIGPDPTSSRVAPVAAPVARSSAASAEAANPSSAADTSAESAPSSASAAAPSVKASPEPKVGESRGIAPAAGKGRNLPGSNGAHDHGSHDHEHPTGHVDHQGLQWPPTPKGAQSVVNRSNPNAGQEEGVQRESQYAALEARFAANEATRSLVGRVMTRLEIVEMVDKASGTVSQRRYQYFDRRANATVTVTENLGNGALSVSSTPAQQSQPEITEGETEEAVAMAKEYFVRNGFPAAAKLQGFGIQAHPASGAAFFDGRVIYVSLHPNADSDPQFVAWVDLSSQRILEARKEEKQ